MGSILQNFQDFIVKQTERASPKWAISGGIQKSSQIDEECKNVGGGCKKWGNGNFLKGKNYQKI